ncbi:PQQ-binding-like beta-propeller repeat protein [bacterium]|nr:PQQ-binding-like beta-propeller repeat protein [bacterium]
MHKPEIPTQPVSPWYTFQHDIRHTGRSPHEGPETPRLLWKFKTGGAIFTPPTIGADGTIYAGSDDCFLYAIKPDGSEKWRYKAEDAVRSTPVLGSDGTIYVGSRDTYLYAIYPDGSLKWKFKTKS